MSFYPTNGYIVSGASRADFHKRIALEERAYARRLLRWFGDRARHQTHMRAALHEWRQYRKNRQIALSNGYRWNHD